MNRHKNFLIRMCDLENLGIKELQEITGKSKSVVYEWFNYSNDKAFPNYDSLSKIIYRLNITIDDFINCRCDRLIDYTHYRTYKNYIVGSFIKQFLCESLKKSKNYTFIINCYIDDCIKLKTMINEFLKGISIETKEFNMLCENIKPFVYSDVEYVFDDYCGGSCYYLNYSSLNDYKGRTELYLDRCENDDEYSKKNIHKIYLPNADDLILHLAEENIDILKRYILLLDKSDLETLINKYKETVEITRGYDSKKKIIKLLKKCSSNFA